MKKVLLALALSLFSFASLADNPSGIGVLSFNSRVGVLVSQTGDYSVAQVTGAAAVASPTFTGVVTTPALTISGITGSTQCLHANSSGVVTGTGSDCGAGGSGVSSFNSRTGAVVPTTGDYTVSQVTGAAPTASPTLTGAIQLNGNVGVGASNVVIINATNGNTTISGTLNVTGQITGNLTGNVTGNASGSAASFTGNLVGDVTGTQGATVISAATVTGKALTGFSASAGTVSAADTILSAFNKIVGNIALLLSINNPTFTGVLTGPSYVSNGTGADVLPAGSTGQRPSGINGMLRYNSTTPAIEGYINNAWTSLSAGGSVPQFVTAVTAASAMSNFGGL